MINKKDNNEFIPTIAIPPGETIRENMVLLGMTQEELAARLGITPKHLNNIINGNAPITYETALKLESVIGPKAQFWMNLETNYQLDKVRLEKLTELNSDIDIFIEDFNEIGKDVPVFGNFKPHGEFLMNDLHKIGGTPLILKFLPQ